MKQYMKHLPSCNTQQNWLEAEQALADTPTEFRDESYHMAIEDIERKKCLCSCGLEIAIENYDHMTSSMQSGRHFLMSVNPSDLTVESALEAFGFGRNGYGS